MKITLLLALSLSRPLTALELTPDCMLESWTDDQPYTPPAQSLAFLLGLAEVLGIDATLVGERHHELLYILDAPYDQEPETYRIPFCELSDGVCLGGSLDDVIQVFRSREAAVGGITVGQVRRASVDALRRLRPPVDLNPVDWEVGTPFGLVKLGAYCGAHQVEAHTGAWPAISQRVVSTTLTMLPDKAGFRIVQTSLNLKADDLGGIGTYVSESEEELIYQEGRLIDRFQHLSLHEEQQRYGLQLAVHRLSAVDQYRLCRYFAEQSGLNPQEGEFNPGGIHAVAKALHDQVQDQDRMDLMARYVNYQTYALPF